MNNQFAVYSYNNVWNYWGIFHNSMDIWELILTFISIMILISGIASIIFILYWGFLMITSWGKEEKIKPALNTIRYAIVWIVVTVLTVFLFPILWRLLWIDVQKYAEPSAIFNKIEEIWDTIFKWGKDEWVIFLKKNSSWELEIKEFPSNFNEL